jgi:hypothetical protein
MHEETESETKSIMNSIVVAYNSKNDQKLQKQILSLVSYEGTKEKVASFFGITEYKVKK